MQYLSGSYLSMQVGPWGTAARGRDFSMRPSVVQQPFQPPPSAPQFQVPLEVCDARRACVRRQVRDDIAFRKPLGDVRGRRLRLVCVGKEARGGAG